MNDIFCQQIVFSRNGGLKNKERLFDKFIYIFFAIYGYLRFTVGWHLCRIRLENLMRYSKAVNRRKPDNTYIMARRKGRNEIMIDKHDTKKKDWASWTPLERGWTQIKIVNWFPQTPLWLLQSREICFGSFVFVLTFNVGFKCHLIYACADIALFFYHK